MYTEKSVMQPQPQIESVKTALIEKKSEKLSEKELKELPLVEEEKAKVPQFSNAFTQFFAGIFYAPYSLWFGLKHTLYCKMGLETGILVSAMLSVIAASCGLSYLIWYIIGIKQTDFGNDTIDIAIYWIVFVIYMICLSTIFAIFFFAILQIFFQWYLGMCYNRVSVFTELVMRGQKSQVKPCFSLGGKFNLLHCIMHLIFEGLLHVLKHLLEELVLHVIWPSLLAVINVIPVFGQVIYFFLVFSALFCKLGYRNMETVFMRKHIHYIKSLKYTYKHFFTIFGFGFGSFCIYLIPGINILYYFYADIAGTRLFIHLEEREKMNAEEKEHYENQQILSQQQQVNTNVGVQQNQQPTYQQPVYQPPQQLQQPQQPQQKQPQQQVDYPVLNQFQPEPMK